MIVVLRCTTNIPPCWLARAQGSGAFAYSFTLLATAVIFTCVVHCLSQKTRFLPRTVFVVQHHSGFPPKTDYVFGPFYSWGRLPCHCLVLPSPAPAKQSGCVHCFGCGGRSLFYSVQHNHCVWLCLDLIWLWAFGPSLFFVLGDPGSCVARAAPVELSPEAALASSCPGAAGVWSMLIEERWCWLTCAGLTQDLCLCDGEVHASMHLVWTFLLTCCNSGIKEQVDFPASPLILLMEGSGCYLSALKGKHVTSNQWGRGIPSELMRVKKKWSFR